MGVGIWAETEGVVSAEQQGMRSEDTVCSEVGE